LLQLLGTEEVDSLADYMVKEIQQGMDGTEVRAGIIKVATSGEMTSSEEKVLRAAARASLRTGAAITTHTDLGRLAIEQLDLLASEGADLRRVVVGHLGGWPDLDLHLEIARRGAYLGYDRVGKLHRQTDDTCAGLIEAMVAHGYLKQITVSHDTGVYMWGRFMGQLPADLPSHSMNEQPSYSYVMRSFLPRLRRSGLTEADLTTMMVDNPARFLSI
jgi:phosphotriesterase-related protein